MIPIKDIAGALNAGQSGRRHLAIFRFYLDESYDSDPLTGGGVMFQESSSSKPIYVPRTYVVSGFFSNEMVWAEIERRWVLENKRAGVTRFHASSVNARDGEFSGWSKDQQVEYSKNLIQILRDQGSDLHALSCGIWASDYVRIINPHGRRKMGVPYLACFNSCISLIAQEMEIRGFPKEDKFAVIIDRGPHELEAVESFYRIKGEPSFPYRHRLATCAPGGTEEFIPLECADLIAYETFKLVDGRHAAAKTRKALELMFLSNGFIGHGIDADNLHSMKRALEAATCPDGCFVVQHAPLPVAQ